MKADSLRSIGIIPVRMAASRFPGKPLAPILGMSMVEHVYRRACLCPALQEVIVATCDEEIREEAQRFGAEVIMTSDKHERAAERVAEAAGHKQADIVVLVQGDEPLLHPAMLGDLVEPFKKEPDLLTTNLMLAIDEADALDPDQIKVACDAKGNALFMSREPLPTRHSRKQPAFRWRQIGLIAFRKPFLMELMAMPPTPLEQAESVDMLRALEYGYRVRMVPTQYVTYPVDSPKDIQKVEQLLLKDEVLSQYMTAGKRS